MTGSTAVPAPLTTNIAAVILGASAWPNHPNLTASEAFLKSAEHFRSYLLDANGLGLRQENVLWLFDDSRTADEIDQAIGHFLREKVHEAPAQLTDVIVYYTGHGGFTEGDDKYFLAVRVTRKGFTGSSGYRLASLARTLNEYALDVRRFLILDCCFAARAAGDFFPKAIICTLCSPRPLSCSQRVGRHCCAPPARMRLPRFPRITRTRCSAGPC